MNHPSRSHAPTECWAILVAVGMVLFTFCASMAFAATPKDSGEKRIRCGWFDNPTPNNASLIDSDGEWSISTQGWSDLSHQAVGDWPTFRDKNFVLSGNGGYGHGCACMTIKENRATKEIVRIISSKEKSPSACRNDPKLKKLEPFNPLKE